MVGSETVANGDILVEQNIDFDWGCILDDDNFFFAAGEEGFSNPLSIGDIEEILMKEDDAALVMGEELPDNFFSDILLDSPAVASSPSEEVVGVEESGQSGEIVGTPDSKGSSGSEVQQKADNAAHVLDDDNDDDPIAKKRKRQLRNRDAAVRSRERKKMYVRDLELKSKYYESECKRLGIMLHCCLAENQALRVSWENSKAGDASIPRQESAVLLLESLLLGSLLWFLGIICLFILPSHLLSTQLRVVPQEGHENKNQGSLAPQKVGSRTRRIWVNQSMMGKRYKASKPRIKCSFVPAGILWFAHSVESMECRWSILSRIPNRVARH